MDWTAFTAAFSFDAVLGLLLAVGIALLGLQIVTLGIKLILSFVGSSDGVDWDGGDEGDDPEYRDKFSRW